MEISNISIKSPTDVKIKAETFFNSVGLNMSSGINLYLSYVAQENKIPFSIEKKINEPIPVEVAYIKENSFTYHLVSIICNSVSNLELSSLAQTYILDDEFLKGNPAELIESAKKKGYNFSVVPIGGKVKLSIKDIRKIGDWGEVVISKAEYSTNEDFTEFRELPITDSLFLDLYYEFKDDSFKYVKSEIASNTIFNTSGLSSYMTNLLKRKKSANIIEEIVIDAIKSAGIDPDRENYYKKNGLIVRTNIDILGKIDLVHISDFDKNIDSYEDCVYINLWD